MEWFHSSHEQVVAVIEFAARSLDAPPAQPPARMLDAAKPENPENRVRGYRQLTAAHVAPLC
jgi:hypothetical protein